MRSLIVRFVTDESGATAIEYAIIASVIMVGIVAGLTNMKSNLNPIFSKVSGNLS